MPQLEQVLSKNGLLTIIRSICEDAEEDYDILLEIDQNIIEEISVHAIAFVKQYQHPPNAAKIAGSVAYWIRKLKPITHAHQTTKKLLIINELVSVHTGLAICAQHESRFKVLSTRVLSDWVNSLRYHGHSPRSTTISFELLVDAGR